MNFFGSILLAVAIILQIIGSYQTEAYNTDPKVILQNGFLAFNRTLAKSEGFIVEGLDNALKIVKIKKYLAEILIQNGIKKGQAEFFESGAPLFISIGKALSICSTARPTILTTSVNYSTIALNALNSIRTGLTLGKEGVDVGGNAAKQAILSIRKDFQANFAALYKQIPISLQVAIQAVLGCNKTLTADEPIKSSDDNDAKDAISELNKAAAIAIRNGANPSKVRQLRNLLTNLIIDTAELASYTRNGFLNFINSVDTDLSSAKKSFKELLEYIDQKNLEIFLNGCFDIGIVAADYNFSKQQLQKSYKALEVAIIEAAYANFLLKDIAVRALIYEGRVREDAFDAAAGIAKFAKLTFMQKLVEAGKAELWLL